MSARIQLSLSGSSPRLQNYVFTEPQTCTIGRATDCTIVLPTTTEYCDVSRHHCSLRIDPPFIHVRDLGSMNGTFVNNDRIGGSTHAATSDDSTCDGSPGPDWVPLHDRDELRLGRHAILVLDIREFTGTKTKESLIQAHHGIEPST